MSELKTPLRYPGGKSKACEKLFEYSPSLDNIKEYREPFIGGGSYALYLQQKNPFFTIWVNDLYFELYNFWIHLRDHTEELSERLLKIKKDNSSSDKARILFQITKEAIKDHNGIEKAVDFYIINKCSFSGLTESSSFSETASISNFSINGIIRLKEYHRIIKNWKITNLSYEQLLTNDPTIFVYLDPPYEIKDSLYGKKGEHHKTFDHDEFAKQCCSHSSPMLISYNTSDKIINRFPNWKNSSFAHTYTMRSKGDYLKEQKERREMLLWNY